MPKVVRVRCPLCGAMPTLANLEQTQNEKPAEIRLFLQEFGGKVAPEAVVTAPYTKKGRGSAPGFMQYTDVTNDNPEELEEMGKWFDARIQQYLDSKGLKVVPK